MLCMHRRTFTSWLIAFFFGLNALSYGQPLERVLKSLEADYPKENKKHLNCLADFEKVESRAKDTQNSKLNALKPQTGMNNSPLGAA
jgi:hypothetical protein